MPQSNFLLVVDPVLIVGPEAGVQNPLLKTQVACRQVFGKRVALWRSGMSGEVRNAGDDTAAPVIDYLLGLVCEHLAREPQVVLVLLGKSGADFQFIQIPHRDRRRRHFGRPVRVSRNIIADFFHPMPEFVR